MVCVLELLASANKSLWIWFDKRNYFFTWHIINLWNLLLHRFMEEKPTTAYTQYWISNLQVLEVTFLWMPRWKGAPTGYRYCVVLSANLQQIAYLVSHGCIGVSCLIAVISSPEPPTTPGDLGKWVWSTFTFMDAGNQPFCKAGWDFQVLSVSLIAFGKYLLGKYQWAIPYWAISSLASCRRRSCRSTSSGAEHTFSFPSFPSLFHYPCPGSAVTLGHLTAGGKRICIF